MSNVLTNQFQNKISRYFLKLENQLLKPELSYIREMTIRILKSGTVLVNKIASSIHDMLTLSQTTKRFKNQFNKKDLLIKLFCWHIHSIKSRICQCDYIFFDDSNIQKRYAKMIEVMDFVKGGYKESFARGYWLMHVLHFSNDKGMISLFNNLFSFDQDSKSENTILIGSIFGKKRSGIIN